ncbi:MAG: holo-ACP synthase [Alphaproteobacteria bacterium]
MILGIGMDICTVARITAAHAKYGAKLEERILTPAERKPSTTDMYLASRWAAKEAVAKALGCGIGRKLSFQDIHIAKHPSGQPYVQLSAKAQKSFAGITLHLSLTHENDTAAACVVAEKA